MTVETEAIVVDFIVLGGGMAGTSAAGYAASRGASVCWVEKSPELGGSALISGGTMWSPTTYEKLREELPDGDPVLQKALMERFPRAREWMQTIGVEMGPELTELYGFGVGNVLDMASYLRCATALVDKAGGMVLRSTTPTRLIIEDGRVQGVEVRSEDGTMVPVRAKAVVICTGGFQGNSSMLHNVFGTNARQLLLRANPNSTGDGILLGLSAGSALAGDMTTFYGHPVAWPVTEFAGRPDFGKYGLSSQALVGLLVNLTCDRFVDESSGNQRQAIGIVKQPHGRAALLMDAASWGRLGSVAFIPKAPPSTVDKVAELRRLGCRVATSDTIEGLAELLRAWGFEAERLQGTIDRYNAMARGGSSEGQPGRKKNLHEFGPGPYTAFECRPAITATQGGLRIDDQAHVLDQEGKPIPGLFAAGADIGGFFNGGYAGSLCVAATFAMSAVENVLGSKLFGPPAGALAAV